MQYYWRCCCCWCCCCYCCTGCCGETLSASEPHLYCAPIVPETNSAARAHPVDTWRLGGALVKKVGSPDYLRQMSRSVADRIVGVVVTFVSWTVRRSSVDHRWYLEHMVINIIIVIIFIIFIIFINNFILITITIATTHCTSYRRNHHHLRCNNHSENPASVNPVAVSTRLPLLHAAFSGAARRPERLRRSAISASCAAANFPNTNQITKDKRMVMVMVMVMMMMMMM